MKVYRNAVMEALKGIASTRGMDRFAASPDPAIERCYEELQDCQFCICLVGLRYGSLYRDTGLSYSELEFNKADELGIPVLAFIQDGSLDTTKIDMDNVTRLASFKKKLDGQGNTRQTKHFRDADELRSLVKSAMEEEVNRREQGTNKSAKEDYLSGAAIYKNFIRLPARYKGKRVRLRVRVDGTYGSWRLKEELYEAFGFDIGNAIYLNDLYVLGVDYGDIGNEARNIDMFAGGEDADWFLQEEITKGDIFEGDFELAFQYARNIAGKSKVQFGPSDAYIAKLLFRGNGKRIKNAADSGTLNARFDAGMNDNALSILRQLLGDS